MPEELDLTMEALEELYRSPRWRGWDLRVYDYSGNVWRDADEAFATPGTYELAVLTRPGTRPLRVRVMPPSSGGVQVDPISAGEMAVWRTLGLDLRSRHLAAIRRVLEGKLDPVTIEELAMMLEEDGGGDALETRAVILELLEPGRGSF